MLLLHGALSSVYHRLHAAVVVQPLDEIPRLLDRSPAGVRRRRCGRVSGPAPDRVETLVRDG